ncbi:hypothetical protein TRAPUB_13132 [Trametes pubescens]|uniref:F-box domain-containing protein n=1 Tax=Trametes pubescens TaxID=154538 RepID=A0A1M2VS02_TRAPU|nr:hypothetical protein TRAPUB_13132 [Trametes pubescens]
MVYLPQEIVDYIINHLASDETIMNADLANAALISRAWRFPSQSQLHRSQLFSPPPKRLLSRIAWFQESDGQRLVPYVKDVQFWRLDADSKQFCTYWKSVLGTFTRAQDVSIQFHNAALHWQPLLGPSPVPLPSFPSVTTLRLSNVAFATCHNLLALVSTLPNLTSLHMDHENWACGALMGQGLADDQGQPLQFKALCNGEACAPIHLKHLVIDCTDGLDLLECAVRHVDLSALVSLNVALPADPKSSRAGMAPLLMGVHTASKPDFPHQEAQVRALLCGMDALETAVFRVPADIACNPIIPQHTPRLRHFAIHYLRPDLFAPSAARPKLSCVSDALAQLVSPALATVNITLSLSALPQLVHLPWAEIDGVLADADAFPALRECAFNIAYVKRGEELEKPCRMVAMARVRVAIRERLPMLVARGVVGVHEAEDFVV